jgi:hypothetical protein
MKLIRLTNSLKHFIVDDEDYERCQLFKWGLNTLNDRELNIRSTIDQITLSNFLMNDKSSEFDHTDRDIYNNQKSNLRKCTHNQNCMNRKKSTTNHATSKYKGVDWRSNRYVWRARIKSNNMQINLGTFDSEIKAAQAYNRAAKKYFGEFACLNQF